MFTKAGGHYFCTEAILHVYAQAGPTEPQADVVLVMPTGMHTVTITGAAVDELLQAIEGPRWRLANESESAAKMREHLESAIERLGTTPDTYCDMEA